MSETEVSSDNNRKMKIKNQIRRLIIENEALKKEIRLEKQKCRMRKRKQEEIKSENDKKTQQEFNEISKMFEELKQIRNLLNCTAQETNQMMMVVFGPGLQQQEKQPKHHKRSDQLLDENEFLIVRDIL